MWTSRASAALEAEIGARGLGQQLEQRLEGGLGGGRGGAQSETRGATTT